MRQQNEVLLSQQTQINELRSHLYNAATLLQTQNNNNNIPYSK